MLYWLPALLWACVVLAASSDTFSAQHTGSILFAVWNWIFGRMQPGPFDTVHFLIRKSAHFTEYAILSALWFRAWRGEDAGTWRSRWLLPALLLALAVAAADEWHQAFVPSRGSSARDVLLDFCGAAFAQLVIWLALRQRQRVQLAATD
jgi:VanZ family protein